VYVKFIGRSHPFSNGIFLSCQISILTSASRGPSAIAELLVYLTTHAGYTALSGHLHAEGVRIVKLQAEIKRQTAFLENSDNKSTKGTTGDYYQPLWRPHRAIGLRCVCVDRVT